MNDKEALLLAIVGIVILSACGNQQPNKVPPLSDIDNQPLSSNEYIIQQSNLVLFNAVSRNNIRMAKHALAAGADINSKNIKGHTPLMLAAALGSIDMAKFLAVKEAEPDSHHKGWTSLHRAAFYGNIEIVDFLLGMGLDVDVKDNLGQTPIHWPSNYGRLKMVGHLVAKGADVNAVAVDGFFLGQTPVDAAAKGNQDEVESLLRRHGGKSSEELNAIMK